MKLLLAEDDPLIGHAVEKGLRMAGFTVDWVRDGRHAQLALERPGYNLLLLDLGHLHQAASVRDDRGGQCRQGGETTPGYRRGGQSESTSVRSLPRGLLSV